MAWMPEYLMRISKALCDLVLLTPEKLPTTNSPYNSLKSIFRTWYPQTNANADERKTILGLLIKKYPNIVFKLMIGMTKTGHDTAFHSPRPRMRLFSELREISVSVQEVLYMINFYIDTIIEKSKGDFSKISSLIKLLDNIDVNRTDELLTVIESAYSENIEANSKIYHLFRNFLGRHRSYPSAIWSLPEHILEKIELTANKFKSNDDILNEIFLFEEPAPVFIDGREDQDYRVNQEFVSNKRIEFVKNVISKFGIEKIFELNLNAEHPYIYGNVLSLIPELSSEERMEIFKKIGSENAREILLATEFIRVSEIKSSMDEQTRILEELISNGLSKKGIVNFLKALNNNINLWKYVEAMKNEEIESLFWKSQVRELYINDKTELFFAISKLNQFNKHITLLNTLGMSLFQDVKNVVTSDEVLKILEMIDLTNLDDNSQFDYNHFHYILDFLYSKSDYDVERGAKIEMKYFFVYDSSRHHSPKNLFQVMSEKPEEYIDFLKYFYLPEDDELRENEIKERESEENYKILYEFKYNVFDKFNLIPSLKSDDTIDEKALSEWVNKVRELAKENFRLKSADHCIGQLLAKYPISISKKKGFAMAIYNIIEEINSHEMKLAFDVQIGNNLSLTSRGAYEGGNIERFRAEYFDSLFEQTKITHPNVSLIFKNRRDDYIKISNWEDENALLRSLS